MLITLKITKSKDEKNEYKLNINNYIGYENINKTIDKILEKGKLPIVSGGSGFYAKIAFEGIDSIPEITSEIREKVGEFIKNDFEGALKKLLEIDKDFANSIDIKNPRKVSRGLEIFELTGKKPTQVFAESKKPERPPYKAYCLTVDREKLIERINLRVDNMVKIGLFEEVENLLKVGVSPNCSPMTSIGYKEIVAYFQGKMTKDEAIERIKISTRQFAKRQYTWFRKYSDVNWVNVENIDLIKQNIKEIV